MKSFYLLEIQLKKTRDKAILSKPTQLLKLSVILENACSDDETDNEAVTAGHSDGLIPCRVRNLDWRSEMLRRVWILLDGYVERSNASIPKLVRKKTGRPPRPRIRQDNAPLSKITAARGLPVDCYSSVWIEKIKQEEPLLYNELEVDPVPANLEQMILVLEGI